MLNEGLGGTAFFLVCATLGLVMLGMAANEWRRLGTDDYRRVATAAGLLLAARLVGAALLAFGLSTAPWLEWALEGLTLALFTWAFLLKTFASPRWAALILFVSVGAVAVLAAACALLGAQFARWELTCPGALVLLSGLALGQWLRFRRRLSPWLGCAFLLSMGGGIAGLAGFGQAAPALHLTALTLLAIEIYRSILADLSAYGQELQSVSERALRQTQEMAFLLEVSHAIASSLDLSVVLERVSESVARAMNVDWAYILLPVEGHADALSIAARYGWWGRRLVDDSQTPSQVMVRSADFVLLRKAIAAGQQVLANEPADYEPFDRLHDLLGRPQTGPTLVQPILVKKQTLGVLLLGNVREDAVFSPVDAKLCEALAAQVATAIENARLYHSVDEQARRLAGLLRVREEDLTQRQAILESIADGVVVAGNSGEVLLANAAAERILGLPRQQLIGQTIKRLYAELLRTRGRGKGEQALFEWGDRLVRGSLAPVKMPDGVLLGYVAVFRDVTHERQAELSKSEFIATVSHELRTPMTSIKGYVDLLRFGAVGGLNPQQIHFLEVVGKNSERMIGLVNNLIAVSEMERGAVRIESRPVDLRGVIEEAVQAVRSEAADRQLDLSVSVPPRLPPVQGDPERLRQVVDNLLDNALHYTPEGGRIDVWAAEAHLESGECHLVVNVRDTGVGIPLEEQERIFEKFYRAENPLSVEAGGTGMGLAIVKTLVEAHGGRVWVESQPDRGSTFRFAVPALTTEK